MQILSSSRALLTEDKLSPAELKALLNRSTKSPKPPVGILRCGTESDGLLLFVLQGEPYAAGLYKGGEIRSFPIERFQAEVQRLEVPGVLYTTNPVFFKLMLVLAQSHPSIVGNTRVINMESLLEGIEKSGQEHLLVLKRGTELNLFYYREGRLADGYFTDPARFSAEQDGLAEAMLVYLYEPGPPLEVRLYELKPEASPPVPATNGASTAVSSKAQAEEEWLLEVVEGPKKGSTFPLSPGKKVSLGRRSTDIQLEDSKISRRHAEIEWIDGQLHFQDLKSTNGSFINEKPVSKHPLASGDIVCLGESVLRVKRRS